MRFAGQGIGGRVGIQAPVTSGPVLASHLSGARAVCGERCRDCSPAHTWRDQDPVLSKVMK